ncbi:MAG: 2,3-diphosphoglycerate synthetase [Gaiellales bacterium]
MSGRPALALIDGEHYPPVVRDALEHAGRSDQVVAALLLGGTEKLVGDPDYGVSLERVGDSDPAESMLAAARRHGATRVIDLSDEPVLTADGRFRLASHALAAGLDYVGPDFWFRPPPQTRVAAPTLAVIGTGKRIGKTAVSAYAARLLHERSRVALGGREIVVVAMGRGGPPEPELVEGGAHAIGVADLLSRARAGEHAASDFLEDAALARVTTVGARRCGGGLAGAVATSNVVAAAELAAARDPGLVLLEGSGAALPPVVADRTVLVTSAARPAGELLSGLGPFRVLRSQLVVVTMCESPLAGADQVAAVRDAVARVAGVPTIATVLRPVPTEPVSGRRVAYFTTAPPAMHERLAGVLRDRYGAEVVAVCGSLSDRPALRLDLERPEVLGAEVFLMEIKAAAIDVVAEAAVARGVPVVFCDNRPEPLPGQLDLDQSLLSLAQEAVAAHA